MRELKSRVLSCSDLRGSRLDAMGSGCATMMMTTTMMRRAAAAVVRIRMRSQATASLTGKSASHPETGNGSASPTVVLHRTTSVLCRSPTQRHPSVRGQLATARCACCFTPHHAASCHICRFACRLHIEAAAFQAVCMPQGSQSRAA